MASPVSLLGKSFLTLESVSENEILHLLDLADRLKRERRKGRVGCRLDRRIIGLVFEKPSTRTRCAATVAAVDEGGSAEYFDAGDIHLGRKESVADTARVLGRMLDGILFRGYRQEMVEELDRHAGIPVWNGLTDTSHPTQILADLMTVREAFGRLRGLKIAYVGDGRNNVAHSLMIGCAKLGIHIVNCTPRALFPRPELMEQVKDYARAGGGTVVVSPDPDEAVRGANVVYTDVWVSMGEEKRFAERVALLKPYRVDMAMMRRTGNIQSGRAIFLHCLPAFHDANTAVTKSCGALEVTDDVFEAPFSRVFDQAENKVHTLKALMVASLGPGRRHGAGGRAGRVTARGGSHGR